MSDSKTEGGSGSSPSVPRSICGVCEHEQATNDDWGKLLPDDLCWASVGKMSHAQRDCFRWGYVRLLSVINEEPRRQAPPEALARARAEGRAAALEDAARYIETMAGRTAFAEWAVGIRALLNQGRDEVAPSPEIPAESTDPEAR